MGAAFGMRASQPQGLPAGAGAGLGRLPPSTQPLGIPCVWVECVFQQSAGFLLGSRPETEARPLLGEMQAAGIRHRRGPGWYLSMSALPTLPPPCRHCWRRCGRRGSSSPLPPAPMMTGEGSGAAGGRPGAMDEQGAGCKHRRPQTRAARQYAGCQGSRRRRFVLWCAIALGYGRSERSPRERARGTVLVLQWYRIYIPGSGLEVLYRYCNGIGAGTGSTRRWRRATAGCWSPTTRCATTSSRQAL